MLKILHVAIFCLSFMWMTAQCETERCSICQVNAKITSISGGTILVDSIVIDGVVSASTIQTSLDTLEIFSNSCGDLQISVELDFIWERGNKSNWIHGVSFVNSSNWLAAQGVIIPPDPGWIFQNSITGICSGNTYDAGYYWDKPGTQCNQNRSNYNGFSCVQGSSNCEEDDSYLVDGDPRDNYGISCTDDCPNFGFNLVYCPINGGTNTEILTFILTEDGETGGWARSDNCVFTLNFPIRIGSSGVQIPDLSPTICKDSCILLDAGVGCESYIWSTGDTTEYIEVCPDRDSTFTITVQAAATGCEITSTIDVKVEDCCSAYAGEIEQADTIFVCPFESPEIVVNDFQSNDAYTNLLYMVDHDYVYQSTIDSVLVFKPGKYNYDYVHQCDTYTVYSVNILDTEMGSFFPTIGDNFSDLVFDCYDIDSIKVIVRDDYPPEITAPIIDSVRLESNTRIYTEDFTINCIGDKPEIPNLEFSDNCILRDSLFIPTLVELIPCESSFSFNRYIVGDHCGNNLIYKQNVTLEPDDFTYDIEVTDEYCNGESNGVIDILNQSHPNTTWSIDGGPFLIIDRFENLSPGEHLLEAIGPCDCPYYDTVYINDGPELSIDILDTMCLDNNTLGIPDDDSHLITLVVTSDFAISDSCIVSYQGNVITAAYGEQVMITTEMNTSDINIEASDNTNIDCKTSVTIENLTTCSGVCMITPEIVNDVCFDNETRGYPDDDYYEITLMAIVENTVSDSFLVADNNGKNIGTIKYGELSTIVLAASDVSEELIFTDKNILDCSTILTTPQLTPCSGVCEITANIVDVICHDNGTRDNPYDDTWSFSVTANIFDGSGTCKIQQGLKFGFFKSGDTITLEDIPIDSFNIELIVMDSMLGNCDTFLVAQAPEACSPCLAEFDLITTPENCPENNDGALFVEIFGDTLIGLSVDGSTYEEGETVLAVGEHSLTIHYGDDCYLDTVFNIESIPLFEVYHDESYIVEYLKPIHLEVETNIDVEEINQITWSPPYGLSCADCLVPTFIYDTTTTYLVTIEDVFGCIARDTVNVEVFLIPKVHFPNIIHRNSQYNGCLYPISNDERALVNNLSIYDRWGNKVFQNNGFSANDKSNGWCGDFQNTPLTQGVYIYTCNVTLSNGVIEIFSGDVTLID